MRESPSSRIEIVCQRLFDGCAMHDRARVTVEDGRIVDVSTDARQEEPIRSDQESAGAVSCEFLMPGLIDSHVHICGYREGLPAGEPFEPVKNFLRLCVANGVTTLRDTGNALETIYYAREWSERYDGPRVFSSGPLLDTPPLTWAFSRIVRDGDSARRHVTCLADEGVDLIKAYRGITPEVLRVIINAASERSLPVAIDSQCTPVRQSSALGVRSLEHMANIVDPEPDGTPDHTSGGSPGAPALRWSRVDPTSGQVRSLGEQLAEKGTFVVPTLLVTRRWTFFNELVGDPNLRLMAAIMPYHRHLAQMSNPMGGVIGKRFVRKYMPVAELSKSERAQAERGTEMMGEVMCRYQQAGVSLAAGTDSPNPSLTPGLSLHQELAEMVRRGLEPVDALRAATSGGGTLMDQQDLGVVRPGARADLLLLDSHPDRDITSLGRIRAVMKGGRWVDREMALSKVAEAAGEL